jgi:protein-disulfide isomerase
MSTTTKILPFALLCAAFLGLAPADANNDAPPSSHIVLAEINGTKLSLADFEAKHPTALFQARNAFYQAERKALDNFIDEYLLEREAQREHLSVAQLLDQHIQKMIGKDPSEESLHVYYEGLDTAQSYEALRSQILEKIHQSRLVKARAAYLKTLRSESAVTIRFDAPRAAISLKDTPVRGAPNAPVMLVEYADYECPFCQKIAPTLDKLQAEYGPKLAMAYKDLPLPMHQDAPKAAEAAHCAGAQGKYWEYHDLLYSSKQLEPAALKEHARALKLDTGKFDKCLDSGEQAKLVQSQLEEGRQDLQLEGTPSYFINGRYFTGALTYEQLRTVIDEELGERAAHPNTATLSAK